MSESACRIRVQRLVETGSPRLRGRGVDHYGLDVGFPIVPLEIGRPGDVAERMRVGVADVAADPHDDQQPIPMNVSR